MGKNGLFMVLFVTVIGSVMVNHCAVAQTVHVVGDSLGWIVPTNDDVYDNWSDNKVFRVGDILTFNFVTGSHSVAEVSEALYDACTPTTTIGNITVTGPANVTLTSVGEHYYICTVGNHCSFGQKLDITVTAAASAVPPPPPSPPAATPPPSATPRPMTPPPMNGPTSPTTPAPITPTVPTTPEGSSSSVVLASVMGTVMSVAVCLLL